MSKFLLNFIVQIPKTLVNSKNPIFNSEILFPCFRPGQPCGPHGLWPSRPPLCSPLSQAEAHRPAQAAQAARAVGLNAEVRFLLGFTPFILDAFSLSAR
jgi:hypothetical protein